MQLFFVTVNVIPQTYFTHNNLNISISIIHSKKHIIDKVNFKTKRFQIQFSNSEPFTNQQFFHWDWNLCSSHCNFSPRSTLWLFKRRKNDFGWSSLNPFSEISFFEIIQMQVGKSVLLWRNASFQKQGNASLEISCKVWANLLVRRSRGSSSSNFETLHLQLPSIA